MSQAKYFIFKLLENYIIPCLLEPFLQSKHNNSYWMYLPFHEQNGNFYSIPSLFYFIGTVVFHSLSIQPNLPLLKHEKTRYHLNVKRHGYQRQERKIIINK